MTFYEKVNGLCKQRGISITTLIKELGFSRSAATTWKNSDNWPRNSTMKAVGDYFSMTVDVLTEGVDEPINYANVDTSGFDQPVFRLFLDEFKGNEKQAIKRYLAFKKQEAQDAMNDPDRLAIYQNNGGVVGVQGHAHAPVKVVGGSEHTLSDQESEMLRIFSELTFIEQSKVIVYAAELKDKRSGV